MRYLILNGKILSTEPDPTFYKSNILIDGEEITYIGHDKIFENIDETIDASNCVILPGLFNAHVHSHGHFNRGVFDNLPLEIWMALLRPFNSDITATKDEIYLRTLFGCIEMLKTGTTSIIDDIIQTPFNDEENLDAIFEPVA